MSYSARASMLPLQVICTKGLSLQMLGTNACHIFPNVVRSSSVAVCVPDGTASTIPETAPTVLVPKIIIPPGQFLHDFIVLRQHSKR